MHLVNNYAEKYGIDMDAISAKRQQAFGEKTTSVQTSQADCVIDGVKHVQINLTILAAEYRRPIWEWLKENQPYLAELIAKDAQLQQIKKIFKGQIKIHIPLHAAQKLGLR